MRRASALVSKLRHVIWGSRGIAAAGAKPLDTWKTWATQITAKAVEPATSCPKRLHTPPESDPEVPGTSCELISTHRHQRRRLKIGDPGIAVDSHQQIRFSQDASQNMNDTFHAVERKSISIRPAMPTAVAPSANALMTSVPERLRIKQNGGIAGGFDDARQQIHRRNAAVGLTAAMV